MGYFALFHVWLFVFETGSHVAQASLEFTLYPNVINDILNF